MAALTAIRIVRDDWGSPIQHTRVFMSVGAEVECESGLWATTLRHRTLINTARGVLRSQASPQPSLRMLVVEIDEDHLVRHVGDLIVARRVRVLREITGDELVQISDGEVSAGEIARS